MTLGVGASVCRFATSTAAGFATIPESGFGPFGGQLVVADFQNATVLRVALEQVNGRWQGAVFPFLKGFGSGANRVLFDPQGRLYVGGVDNAAWPSAGPFEQALERVTFTGKTPFDIQHVHARPDGFELAFTAPVNREFAGDPDSYFVSQFNYRHHQEYGSPEFDHDGKLGSATTIGLSAAEVSDDGLSVVQFDEEADAIDSERTWTLTLRAREDLAAPPSSFTFGVPRVEVASDERYRFVDADLLAVGPTIDLEQRYGLTGEVLATARGQALEGLELHHPFYERKVPVVLGEHVTLDAGTGLVRLEASTGRGPIPRDDVAATLVELLDTPATAGLTLELISGSTPVSVAVKSVAGN